MINVDAYACFFKRVFIVIEFADEEFVRRFFDDLFDIDRTSNVDYKRQSSLIKRSTLIERQLIEQ